MPKTAFPPWVRQFLVPVTVLLLLLGIPYLLRPVARVFLAVFAGVLLAIFLDGCASLLQRGIPMRRGLALAIVLVLIVLSFTALLWVGGAQVAAQAAGLSERLPAAVATVRSYIEQSEILRRLFSWFSQEGGKSGDILGNLTTIFSSTLEALAHTVIIVFTGIYIALNPAVYSQAVLRLVPPERRPRGKEVLTELGQVMRYWLVGRVAEMAVIGVLTGVGLLLIGAPLALILGVIAGLFSFIPFLGPLLSAVPAILVGLTESPKVALGVVIVFAIVQFVESNLITPFIERRAVSMPPAFVVAGQFLMAVLLGFYGVLLATPLIVLFTVLVQMLYIQDVLDEPVQVLGDRGTNDD
ncbi:MAG: AI-2E family transporter [Desulfuromonadales bacterium]|nr:AI-2E family transporter [Desulfuromonadales bacterium]